jgi:membrane protein YqaA with SNARE-associated domain
MGRIVDRISTVALALGAPGLFAIAFLDSSFLSLPEIADLMVIYMVTHHKARMLLYATSATLGSICGCLVMYYLGKKGGDALVRKRFTTANIERAKGSFQRHGVMTVLVPSLLPPPAPFKIFVLLAGVAHIDVRRFVLAIALGRGTRYLALGLLAVQYGDRALAYMHANAVTVSLIAVGLLLAGFAGYLVWSRAEGAKTDKMPDTR